MSIPANTVVNSANWTTVIRNELKNHLIMKLNLNRNKRYAIPIMTHPGIELIEKTVKAAVTDGQTHADAIIALSENTPSDAATVIMDLTVEAEAFGAKLHFSENDVPSVAERLLHDRNEVENLRIPNTDTARIPGCVIMGIANRLFRLRLSFMIK